MTSQRAAALLALQCALTDAVPGLSICPWPSPPNHALEFPSVGIVPVRWAYKPSQAAMRAARTPDCVVIEVGRHEALVQLRLVHTNSLLRAEVEEKILDLFLRQEMRPGVLVTEISSMPALGSWTCAWELEEEEWQDERAFDAEFWSIITLTGQVPALTRRQAYDIRELRLGMTADEAAKFDDPGVTRVRVVSDGKVTSLP